MSTLALRCTNSYIPGSIFRRSSAEEWLTPNLAYLLMRLIHQPKAMACVSRIANETQLEVKLTDGTDSCIPPRTSHSRYG
jgi:hypothetical protein